MSLPHDIAKLAAGLLWVCAQAPAQGACILYAGAGKSLAAGVQDRLPLVATSASYDVGLLALADAAGRERARAKYDQADVVIIVDERASRILSGMTFDSPVLIVAAPVTVSSRLHRVWIAPEPPAGIEPRQLPWPSAEDVEASTASAFANITGVVTPARNAAATAAALSRHYIQHLDRLVVIAHPNTPIDTLTDNELLRVFRLERQRWPGESRVHLLLPPESSLAMRAVLSKVYGTDAQGLRRHWTSSVYSNGAGAQPRSYTTASGAARAVAEQSGAISAVLARDLERGVDVKVIKIDDKNHDHADYPLK